VTGGEGREGTGRNNDGINQRLGTGRASAGGKTGDREIFSGNVSSPRKTLMRRKDSAVKKRRARDGELMGGEGDCFGGAQER